MELVIATAALVLLAAASYLFAPDQVLCAEQRDARSVSGRGPRARH